MVDENDPARDESTGTRIPGLRTWRGVYVVVIACFLLYVLIMAAFTRAFS